MVLLVLVCVVAGLVLDFFLLLEQSLSNISCFQLILAIVSAISPGKIQSFEKNKKITGKKSTYFWIGYLLGTYNFTVLILICSSF